jgi:hypothetical protein
MLGQTPAAAAPAAAPILTATAPKLAPILAEAAPAAAPAATRLGPTVQAGQEIEYMANRLRQIAEQSTKNHAAVMQAIKAEYKAFGFPTWQKMRDFVFKGETVMPSTYSNP